MLVAARPPVCPILEESRASEVAPRSGELLDLEREPGAPSQGHVGDAALARLAVAADRAAQRRLFRQLKGTLHATLYRVLGSNAHVEELLHRTFIAIFRALPFYRGEDPLALWADRITLRVARQHLRERRSLDAGAGHSESGPSLRLVTSTNDAARHRRDVARLYEELHRLEPDDQIAFALFELDGRSLGQVAELIGVSSVQAQARISRARVQLWAAARRDVALARCLRESIIDRHRSFEVALP
jgi:RNA polymerase sigma-70 factor (ECF subfamily)